MVGGNRVDKKTDECDAIRTSHSGTIEWSDFLAAKGHLWRKVKKTEER